MPQCCRRCMPGTAMTLSQAQEEFAAIVARLSPSKVPQFFAWIKDGVGTVNGVEIEDNDADKKLFMIRKEIKQMISIESCFKHVKNGSLLHINNQTNGINKHLTESDIKIEVDDFLFDDDEINELVKNGKIQRYFCGECGSNDIKSHVFVTHSLNIIQLKYIFTYLLPKLGIQLDDKILVDINSKYGSVIFAAVLFCPQIGDSIGIENDKEYFNISTNIIDNHNLWNKINIINDEFKNQKKILNKCDIIVMNNTFSCLNITTNDEKIKLWKKLRDNLKSKTIIIHSPSLWKSINGINLGFEIQEWLEQLDTRKMPIDYTHDNNLARNIGDQIEVWRVR